MINKTLKNNYQIIEKGWLGYSWGKWECFITDNSQSFTLFVGDRKNKFLKNYNSVFEDVERTIPFLQINSIYKTFKFRNINVEPDTYDVFDSCKQLVGRLQNGNRIINNFWKILDSDNKEIGRLSKTVNFTGFLYDFTWILGCISFGILEILILSIVSLVFPKLLEVKYTIVVDSQVIAELKRVVKPKAVVMDIKILNVGQKIDEKLEKLILAASLRAFPGGNTFYPKNSLT